MRKARVVVGYKCPKCRNRYALRELEGQAKVCQTCPIRRKLVEVYDKETR